MLTALKQLLPAERIKTSLLDRVSYAADAGFYYLLPQAIVQPVSEEEIAALFSYAQEAKIPLVFRAGGTSLSGQSITDGLLVDLSRGWKKVMPDESGKTVTVGPGVTGAIVNARLRKYHRKIGPDPSSISAAMMGGILSNNASGMCCGVEHNSYHTTRSIRFILPTGEVYSTDNKTDYHRFLISATQLAEELISIKKEISFDTALYSKIRQKYTTKNTVGYALNAFLDYEHPLDIFAHLLIGGEGTLAFISEAVMDTIPDKPEKSTALIYFPTIFAACEAIQPLNEAGAAMVELMDRASLRAIELLPGMDPFVQTLPSAAAALLIEFQEENRQDLDNRVKCFLEQSNTLSLLNKPCFTTDPVQREYFWKIRKGLFPAVGAVRAAGTTVILEDIAFPLHNLGAAILSLQELFQCFAYDNAIIFGHAKDGNIHFVVTQAFDTPEEIKRYDHFIRQLVDLVVNRYDGTLKAEHGTGRNMAPFVKAEWGADAFALMQRIKRVADPSGCLNPGVIINENEASHIQHLKQLPVVESEVDKCIECGFCEPVCPSRGLTMTPRRRIVARRVLAQVKLKGDKKLEQELLEQYQYNGLETCAVDGLCAGACPVNINTGDLVKRLRREQHGVWSNRLALLIARRIAVVEWCARLAIQMGGFVNKIAGAQTMTTITTKLRKLIPALPIWSAQLRRPPVWKATPATQAADILYFPACISRLLGGSPTGKKNQLDTFLELAEKAGIGVKVGDNLMGSCCGQIFHSKGLSKAYQHTANDIVDRLWKASNGGTLPVVIDISSCAFTFQGIESVLSTENKIRFKQIRLMDSIDFLHEMVLPSCKVGVKKEKVVLHPVCTLKKTGTEEKFKAIAQKFSNEVIWPAQAGCCGMAGDRGFLFPELTASATQAEAEEVRTYSADGYYSTTRTCEIAMTDAVKKNYESLLYLVNECTEHR
ncbi:FAD-binding and (Fe-S)-binding domain-containing protein [Flavihumibacter sp. UBA7668]|uniref:FAD-binding and (Fe-S)-binding domain-containing protein n=1 Tax=Flavihumibacter sp. UBA7668 TaxID=1946542 RepID=UPI0025C079DE|nr:FAD-binding and (Fe-S)-binding domain-containing protein [Flavihumibacter sp. UBA7668]